VLELEQEVAKEPQPASLTVLSEVMLEDRKLAGGGSGDEAKSVGEILLLQRSEGARGEVVNAGASNERLQPVWTVASKPVEMLLECGGVESCRRGRRSGSSGVIRPV
jgi:hypothetical protein